MPRVYYTTAEALYAAKRRLGGHVAIYDGRAVLHLVQTGISGQNVNVYLNDVEAAERAGIDYRPAGREYDW